MNRSGIEWCDHTWNPITGCRHGCGYCYARRMTARFSGDVRRNLLRTDDYRTVPAEDGSGELYVLDKPMLNETGKPLVYPFGFEPTYHRYRADTLKKLKMGNNIFVGAMADVFGDWVPDEWISDIMEICESMPVHNYLFLTKNPERYWLYGVPRHDNFWYGASVTQRKDMDRVLTLPRGRNLFVSYEPLLEDVCPDGRIAKAYQYINWIIIGAETGQNKDKVKPDVEWINGITKLADDCRIPVFMKDSLIPIVGEENMRREFPEQLKKVRISGKMQKKLYTTCLICRKTQKKSEMAHLLAQTGRGMYPVPYGYMCRDCFEEHCKKIGAEVPELKYGGTEND